MTRLLLYLFVCVLLLPTACSKSSGTTVRVVKPKYHHWWYERKNDKRVKRVKTVRVKN